MKTVTIEGKKYKIRTLPLELAPKVFEVVKDMYSVAESVVDEAADPTPKDKNVMLKVFLAIVDYTQKKLEDTRFFREHSEPLDIPSSRVSGDTSQESVETTSPKAY